MGPDRTAIRGAVSPEVIEEAAFGPSVHVCACDRDASGFRAQRFTMERIIGEREASYQQMLNGRRH